MKTFLYLSDIHSNFEALKHLDSLPEMQDPDCEIRFGGDYIDGVNLEPDAVINTLRYVKSLCDSGKAKAILGNHDRFILDATFRPFNETVWGLNGRDDTLANLGIVYRSPSDLREQLLYHYYDELEWLRDLPYYLVDGRNYMNKTWHLQTCTKRETQPGPRDCRSINSEISMLIIGPPRKKVFWTSLNNISVSCSPARTTIGLEKRSFSLLCWETNDLPTTRKVPKWGFAPHPYFFLKINFRVYGVDF